MSSGDQSLSLWENFIESIAQVLSKALTDKDTEALIVSFNALQERLRQLSVDNLKQLEESKSGRPKLCKHAGSCTGNCIRGWIRSFAITYALKYALGLVPSILTGKIFKRPELFVKLGGRDTTSFALFMSTFISSYKGILCMLRYYRKSNSAINAFVAGTFAGLSILLDKNRSRRVMIALYLSTRTFHFIFRWMWRHHVHKLFSKHIPDTSPIAERRFNSKTRQQLPRKEIKEKAPHSPVDSMEDIDARKSIRQMFGALTMMISSSQILYAYVCEPDTLTKSYLSFLITHGGVRALYPKKPRQYLDAMGSTIAGCAISPSSKFIEGVTNFRDAVPTGLPVDQLDALKDIIQQAPHEFVMCGLQHPPTMYCTKGAVTAFWGEWKRAFQLYAPLNLGNSFDSVKLAHELLKQKDYNATLTFNMDFLKKQINQQVLDSHVELLNGVKDLQELSDIFIAINEECEKLKRNYKKTKAKIVDPYEEMKKLIGEISDISKETDYLRSIQRFLQIYVRLEPVTSLEEYPRAALYIYEIGNHDFIVDSVLKEHGLSEDENILTELQKYNEISEKVRKQGLDWIEEGLKDAINSEVREYFWKAVSTTLEQEITAATKGSQFLRQVLEAGYPKLLRVFLELFNRVALLNNSQQNESNETALLLKTLSSFEAAYISRSSTRLLESVSSILPDRNVVRSLSAEDANKFFRTISSELHAVKFDGHLLSLIMKNVVKATNMFLQKIVILVNTDSPFSITGTIPAPVQLLKIDIINCLFTLSDNIWGLLADYESTVIDDAIDKLTTTIVNQMTHISEAIFLNLVAELQVVIAKVHKEDYKINKPPSLIQTGRPETSLYLHEYMAKVKWVFKEFLIKLQCKEYSQKWILTFCDHLMHLQLLHVSTMPAGDQGKLKIASDLTQIEYVFAQSLSIAHIQLEELKMSRQFKAYRKLLFLKLEKVPTFTAVDYIFVCHYLLLYSKAIPFPTVVCGWSEAEYVQYLERHSDMDIRKVIKKSLDLYLQHVEKEGLKETCIEFPVLRTVLSNWESSD
ncbi:hypothetical protein HK103_007452 [Boothiomyces macroporosus]|uniref:Conserved oligomeric Golgi complex subunit 5 n=1 Tax=Boothiomyces macroporosus TaxID=261099 RepID=A0AAD5UCL1_9FUNG|nr:hypothetical protein HK103_007452 [Boothiomyces macroporosus]